MFFFHPDKLINILQYFIETSWYISLPSAAKKILNISFINAVSLLAKEPPKFYRYANRRRNRLMGRSAARTKYKSLLYNFRLTA